MNFIENVEKKEYEEFVKNHPKSHFMQSYYWGEVMKHKNFTPHYVGIKKDGKLIATALLLKKHLLKNYCYFYAPRGYILDYDNLDVIEYFTKSLKEYGKKHHALFIKIDPDIKLHNLDLDGNVVGELNRMPLIDFLKKLGYRHMGFNKQFTGEQPRFTFRLNLDDDFNSIYGRIHPTTRKILNKGNQYNLDMYIGDETDIDDFYQTMIDTAEREHLKKTPISYYQNFYTILNQYDMSDLYIVKVKIEDLKKTYQNRIDDIHLEIDTLNKTEYKNEKKKENLMNDLNKKLEHAEQEMEEINSIQKDEVILSSIITVKYGNKVWTIHGGNSNVLRELNSNYLLYYQIIKDAHSNGYKVIDFFGTSGEANPDKSNPIYGIHNFKKRLGGEYTEFIGEFDFVIHPFLYFSYKKLLPIYRKIAQKKKN